MRIIYTSRNDALSGHAAALKALAAPAQAATDMT
jgi:hypothetical protein